MRNHAFLSYVRENEDAVDRLYQQLTDSGATVWLDRADIQPGVRWKDAVRSAISNGACFLACFSRESVAKDRSYMNEELSLAIDELRLRLTDRSWFIPLKLSECEIPDRPIGGGQHLSDIHYIDLSNDWDAGVDSLLQVLLPLEERILSLYSSAGQALRQSISRSGARLKTSEFTIGFTGNAGVGISDLLRSMNGFSSCDFDGRSPIAQDGVEVHRIDGVGRILDIRTSNSARSEEILRQEADVLVFVIAAGGRIHMRDLKALQAVPKSLPCLAVISKWDLANEPRDTLLCNTVAEHTGRPVVVFSREFSYSWKRHMNQILIDLGKCYGTRRNRFWRLFGHGR